MALIESSSVTIPAGGPFASAGLDGDRTVVWLRGEHDLATSASLSEAMARAIALDNADLVVDLSEVQFMDTATVQVMVEMRELLRLRSRSLALRAPSPRAQRILGLCGFRA